jgi:hypothetical protein
MEARASMRRDDQAGDGDAGGVGEQGEHDAENE